MPTPMHAPAAQSRDELRVRTSDGVELCVRRLAPLGPSRGSVVLCHGLASNGLALDFPGRSLAAHLAGRGFDCFVPDLRGAGRSGAPDSRSWGLDDYLDYDLPAILALVRRQGRSDRISWVGHSMGGILMILYGCDHPDHPVRRMVAIASALDYAAGNSIYRWLTPARALVPNRFRIPFGFMSRLAAVTAAGGLPLLPELMNFKRSNVELEVRRAILRDGFGPVPMRLLNDLSTALRADGIARRGGAHAYRPLLTRHRIPTMLLAGIGDLQCGVGEVEQTARLLSQVPELQVLLFGKEYGHVDDYGHFDLIVGRRAASEVWPRLVEVLEADVP